ncbi:MAG TPA: hypothetical protein VIV62_04385 [Chthoniobacterales bacterium]
MTSRREQQWLRKYAARSYRSVGAIVDLGCFLGGTTIALAEGLALNRKAQRQQIHAYDLFTWNEGYEAWAKDTELAGRFRPGESFLPEFLNRTEPWRDYIVVHEEDLRTAKWTGGPIEFLYVDAMKSPRVAAAIVSNFFPYLIPGKSYIAHQDYPHYVTWWVHILAYRLRDYFTFAADLPQSTLFRLKRELDPQLLASDLSPATVAPAEIEGAFDYSLRLVGKEKKANVIAAKANAYIARGEVTRADEILKQSRHGPESIADEFNTVRALIERKLAASGSNPH